jgi:SAM-dependent methyltransferase
MLSKNTDKEWQKLGRSDPYYGVVTEGRFRGKELSAEKRNEFFESGQAFVNHVLSYVAGHFGSGFCPNTALDFGCGVGRLLIPLARVAKSVVGVDVSDAMLSEAKKNCEMHAIKNIRLIKSDDRLSLLNEKFDLILSFIVFQHMATKRGERIFERLISLLNDSGIGILHFTYGHDTARNALSYVIKKYNPLPHNFISLIKGKGFFTPQMQMNSYNLNRLFRIVQKNNIADIHGEFTNHSGHSGMIIYLRKPDNAHIDRPKL